MRECFKTFADYLDDRPADEHWNPGNVFLLAVCRHGRWTGVRSDTLGIVDDDGATLRSGLWHYTRHPSVDAARAAFTDLVEPHRTLEDQLDDDPFAGLPRY